MLLLSNWAVYTRFLVFTILNPSLFTVSEIGWTVCFLGGVGVIGRNIIMIGFQIFSLVIKSEEQLLYLARFK